MTTHLDDTQGLDEILSDLEFKLGLDDRDNDIKKDDAKQAILHWVDTEVIGEDDEPLNTIEHSRRNFLRREQKAILIHYGYKQNTKEEK